MKSRKTRLRIIPLGAAKAVPFIQYLPSAIGRGLCILLVQQAPRVEKPERQEELQVPRAEMGRCLLQLLVSAGGQRWGRTSATKKQLLKE